MNDTEFNTLVDATLLAPEDALEDLDLDIDLETSGGILTLTFANGSKVIVNRQGATREIWVAARSGGFHCGRRGDAWVCNTTGEALDALLSRVCSEQAGTAVAIRLD
jgi:CyaY protein